MLLSGDADVALRRRGLVASLEYRLADDWTLSAGGGVTLGGDLLVAGDRYDIDVGPVGQAGVAYRVLDGDGWEPFLLLGASFAASTAVTSGPISGPGAGQSTDESLSALDARFSLTLGETFGQVIAPYITLRGFGGPIFWTLDGADVTGSDKRHFQFGGGLIASTGLLDAYVEIIPLGERSASFGAAVAF